MGTHYLRYTNMRDKQAAAAPSKRAHASTKLLLRSSRSGIRDEGRVGEKAARLSFKHPRDVRTALGEGDEVKANPRSKFTKDEREGA